MPNEVLNKINQELAEFETKKQKLYLALRKDLFQVFKPVFDKHPGVTSFAWNQYSPYNDGNGTTFEIYADTDYGIRINGQLLYDYEAENDELSLNQAELAGIDASIAIYSIPKDFLEDAFGDYNTVTVNVDGSIISTHCEEE